MSRVICMQSCRLLFVRALQTSNCSIDHEKNKLYFDVMMLMVLYTRSTFTVLALTNNSPHDCI
jgi:hypothetical protein